MSSPSFAKEPCEAAPSDTSLALDMFILKHEPVTVEPVKPVGAEEGSGSPGSKGCTQAESTMRREQRCACEREACGVMLCAMRAGG